MRTPLGRATVGRGTRPMNTVAVSRAAIGHRVSLLDVSVEIGLLRVRGAAEGAGKPLAQVDAFDVAHQSLLADESLGTKITGILFIGFVGFSAVTRLPLVASQPVLPVEHLVRASTEFLKIPFGAVRFNGGEYGYR